MAQKNDSNEIEIPNYLKMSKIITWLLYFWVIIGLIALSLRVFLLAFSASTTSNFVDFVYRVSADYLEPFRGIWPPRELNETGYLDVSALFAIIVYLFIAWGFKALVDYVQDKIDTNVEEQKAKLKAAKK